MLNNKEGMLCPSHRCKPGSMLIGVRGEDGMVAILPQPLPVDESFVAAANAHPVPPEQRFRFTNKCIEGACGQWTGKGCGVAERVIGFLDQVPEDAVLPACGIRAKCRWFAEQGGNACKMCPFILTEITEQEVLEHQALL